MKTILLIEDNADILANLKEYLEMEGYAILVAKNGKTGIELAKEFMPDLIVCDVLMPELDGREVLSVIKNTSKISEIPFIFSSSLSEIFNKAKAIKLGADDYLLKPFTLETLLKTVKNCIKPKGTRQGNTLKISSDTSFTNIPDYLLRGSWEMLYTGIIGKNKFSIA